MQKYDAVYGRQSVDRADSISMESQIEYCRYETRGNLYRTFQDKGYSGKNTDRPAFQAMMEAIRQGEVSRVIVYKLDRISRSILDFTAMMEEFQKYGVEFVSCTEKFDTSTPMGRAMLNICIVFAQLERETIQMRVQDAYDARSRKGFYMGGRIPYGYRLEPYVIDGKKTSRYAIEPEEAEVVGQIFAMYANPQTSFGDIIHYLTEYAIINPHTKGGVWDRCRMADMIKNPVYVRADLDIYWFYKEQGAVLHNQPEEYVGVYGCYLYSDRTAGRKQANLAGQHIVLAPHEGIVPSDIWLKARSKCLKNTAAAKPVKAKNTWLAGKIKCGKCGYALTVKKSNAGTGRYFLCSRRMQTKGCEGVGGIEAGALEALIFSELTEHVKLFGILSAESGSTEYPKAHEIGAKLAAVTEEIEKLMEKVPDADTTLMAYINRRIAILDAQAHAYRKEWESLPPLAGNEKNTFRRLTGYMDFWDTLSFDDKRNVLETLVFVIKATENDVEIQWKI